MRRFLWLLLTMTLLGVSACAQTPDWRLVDADTIADETYLILTVPQDDPAQLAAVAAQLEADFNVPLAAEWPLNAIAVHCLVFDASAVADIDALIAAMEADARIRTAQRIRGFQTSEVAYADPLFPLQSSLADMNAPAAHQISTGRGVRIAVVDSAIDSAHPDLQDQIVDTRDFVTVAPNPGAEAHGTAIAGVIAASAGNAAGIVGVAPDAQLLGFRACWQDQGTPGRCNSFSLARAINFAILNDIDVLNLSIGGPQDPLLQELLTAGIAKGMIVIAASGETDTTMFPASLPQVIAAGRGPVGRIPAPMIDVITTAPGDRHRYVSGSSVATAHVSGVVALMLAQSPGLTAPDVATTLARSVRAKGRGPVLDACVALRPPRNC